ncbi:MAG: outer membrane protein assembly factor BamA [Bryobacteraceae bacterium]|nr:outer membrane protein assembly factor BamA [Bryobacteraceae bacterium]MDW8378872.1 outer membrane protein assembly factor BamA [Bryobacterales bacterium]
MTFLRLGGLSLLFVSHLLFVLGWSNALGTLWAQQQPPAEPPKPAQSPPQQKKANPFEAVPLSTEPAQPAKPKIELETPKPAEPAKPAQTQIEDVIEAIEFRGSRRVPQDTLRALIFSRKGDKLDVDALHRDFMALWNSGRFDDITLQKEPGVSGWIIRFNLVERRIVRSIKYEGNKSITISEILDRFKDRRVGLSVETQYDPNKVQRATNVLKEFLAERGRQFAKVEPEIRQIPPSSLEVLFKIVEGPKVKVGKIDIQGNKVFSDRVVIRAMKNLKPIGIPRSILFENIFAKSFDSTKLEEDKDRTRVFYQEKGYFTARVLEHETSIRDVGGGKFRVPLFYMNRPGKRADLKLFVEEGRQYRLNKINFVGMKLFRTPESLTRPLFQMAEGDVFSTAKLRKGLEQMRKLYGQFGYIDFVPEPSFDVIPNSDKLDLTLTVDEGKQFFVRRIDFSGNTTTRDKVIRRELLIDEGDIYNTQLWEVSILRLNQLGYFEVLKENEAATITRDTKNNTVDITLKVKERGRNSVQLNGGVSGIAGSFVGFGYSTNNFLGLGETLSINSQLGDRVRDVTFGFTEPYLFDRPIQAGFTVFLQRFNYDQAREVSLLSGRNFIPLFESLGRDNLLNYVSNGAGFNVFASYQLRRSFWRTGLSFGYNRSNIRTLSTASQNYFEFINFQGLSGPNTLSGIRTVQVVPSLSYNTVDHPITPSRGRSIYLTTNLAFSAFGGNVNMVEPTFDFKYFRSGFKKGHVIGMHFLGRFVSGYGGRVAPPFNRFYMGGENDIRGFDIWGISPIAYIPSRASVPLLNADGSARQQKVIVNGVESFVTVTKDIPIYQLIFPGGDTQGVGNFEYRIPIVGPVVLAAFFDAGLNKISRPGQLALNPGRLAELNSAFPQANFDANAVINRATTKMRTSTGLELQIMMPVVNAPFRLYWAYNPTLFQDFLVPPVVVDRSYFPNNASFVNSVSIIGQPSPFFERRRTFRFTISRTF